MSNAYVGDYEGPAPTSIDWQGGEGNWGIARYSGRQPIVRFYNKSELHAFNSQLQGRPIHHDVTHVIIQHPGEREQMIDRPVQEQDKYQYGREWAQFQRGENQSVVGTPLNLLFPNNPSIADNLRGLGITVVEQLANLSATAMQNVGMGAQDYVNYARAYLDTAQKGVGFHELKKELAERDAQIRILNNRVETLTGQLDQLLKQNAAIIGAMPAAVQPTNFAAQAQVQQFSLPPLRARMPEAKPDRAAAARAAKAAKKAAALEEVLTAEHDESDPPDASA